MVANEIVDFHINTVRLTLMDTREKEKEKENICLLDHLHIFTLSTKRYKRVLCKFSFSIKTKIINSEKFDFRY